MLALQPLVFQRGDIVEPAALFGDQRIGRAVIRVGPLHGVVALRKSHDDVAAMRAERHPHKAARLRKIHVVELLLQLCGKQLGELVLKTLALLVRERQIPRIGTDAQHLWIDQFDREIAAVVDLRARNVATEGRGSEDQQREQPAAISSGKNHHARAPSLIAMHRLPGRAMACNSFVVDPLCVLQRKPACMLAKRPRSLRQGN